MWSLAERLPIADFHLHRCPPGLKRRLHLLVSTLPDGQPLAVPVLVARGRRPGPTLLATGAVHGDEYEGVIAIQDLFDELNTEEMAGSFVGVPVLNGPAFAAATREGAWDHLNLARVFPGSPDGGPSQRLAHAFQAHLLPIADLYADLHAGGNAYAIQELAGYMLRPDAVGERQRAAAVAFGLDLVWGTSPLPGRTLSAAADRNVPAIYIELRGEGRARPADVARARWGLSNLLALLGVLQGDYPREARLLIEDDSAGSGHLQLDHPSPSSGLFVPAVELWQPVAAGQPLGSVRHPDGTTLAVVRAARSGRVLLVRTQPRVFAGDTVAFVLAVPAEAGM
ncbi:MAG: succinylglutamate desuccinylase/aspartoacylase family protein [Chloroflexi bacterium OHK40]